MREAATAAARLESAFERIRTTRMAGLPFLNERLRVEAVGTREHEGEWLTVLVTPWCMNLVLLPGSGPWKPLAAGGERLVAFPAGRYRFIAGHDESLGEYHACSLFSPAQEFADHDTARAVAAAALEALFDPAHAGMPDADGMREQFPAPEPAPAEPSAVSKRDFIRGRFSGEKR